MGTVLSLLMLVLMLALCVLAGVGISSAFSSGAGWLLFWTLVGAGAMGALCGWMGFMFADMEFDSPRAWALGIGLLAVVATAWIPVGYMINGGQIAAYHRDTAPRAQAFVLEHFNEIDRSGNGQIEDAELESAINNLPLTAEHRALVQFVRDEQSVAGHVIDSYETTTWVWISTGNGGGYMSPVTTTTYIYGITRADLEGFTARTNELYKRW